MEIPYDSRFICAAYYLLKDEIRAMMAPGEGFLKFDPYINNRYIRICYYDEKKGKEVAEKVDECINEVEVMEMSKNDA